MADVHHHTAADYALLEDDILLRQCEVDLYRSSGPGGQKRNKTSSAVRLRHRPTGQIVIGTEDRSQHVNKRRAVRRLRRAIALNIRTSIDIERFVPSELLSVCIGQKRQLRIGVRDHRYPAVIGELLDLLGACGMSVRDAAAKCEITTGNLVAFIHKDPKLWERVNQMRVSTGLKPLR